LAAVVLLILAEVNVDTPGIVADKLVVAAAI
jgi:hypothetical protein